MSARTVGVEEELLLLDPATGWAVPGAPSVLRAARAHDAGDVEHELFRHQVEIQTEPLATAEILRAALRAARATAGRAVSEAGLAMAASGVAPLEPTDLVPTDDDRYRAMIETFGDVARQGGTCAIVHVAVESDDEAAQVVDAVNVWLSPVLALSVNSPFAEGRDTGYASWRSRLWSQWPTAGPTEPFGSVENYQRTGRALVGAGAARDVGML